MKVDKEEGINVSDYLSEGVQRLKEISDSIKEKVNDSTRKSESTLMIPIARIRINPNQPRRNFDESSIKSLAQSIKEKGLLQPIILRPVFSNDADYEVVAGERRLRAMKYIGEERIPAVVKEIPDSDLRAVALIENIQREDLSVIEKAIGFYQLKEELGSPESASNTLGVSKKTVERYVKIAESSILLEEILELIKIKNLDFTTSYEFCLLADRLNKLKETNNKKFKRLFKSLLKEKNNKNIIDKARKRLGIKKNETQDIKKIERKNFWESETEYGLNIKVSKIKGLSPEVRENIVSETEKFFKTLGANSLEIKFDS